MKRSIVSLAVLAALAASLQPGHADTPSPGPGNYLKFTHERLRVPMRDGVTLSADLYRPADNAGVAFTGVPVIIQLSPYHVVAKALDRVETDLPQGFATTLVRRGHAFAVVDVRGTYNSGGCWDYGGLKEREDGYDVVEWFGTRPWSNGNVAMIGASYDGTTANAAAIEQPPHLRTIVPISAISRWWGYAYQQSARATSSGDKADADPPSDTPADFMFAYGMVPPADRERIDDPAAWAARVAPCDRVEQTIKGYLDPTYDDFWIERDYLRQADRVQVPVLVAHGLLDGNVKPWEGTAWYQALDVPKILVLGQWPHALPGLASWNQMLLRWMDHWLYDAGNIDDLLGVHVQGNNNLVRRQASWGEGPVLDVPLGGADVSFFDDGALPDTAIAAGIGDGRSWIKVPLDIPSGTRLEGRASLDLSFTSNMPQTHMAAMLCAVNATGACTPVTRAFADARYRESLAAPKDLTPGEQTSMTLEFIDNDYQLAAGHRFELRIGSSNPTWVASDPLRATNTLHLSNSVFHFPQTAA